jgi:hypothetical protein
MQSLRAHGRGRALVARLIAIAAVCHPEAASPLKYGFCSYSFIEVHRLRIEFYRETLDVGS